MKDEQTAVDTIDAYIAGAPKEAQAILKKIRALIKKEAPDAVEAIKYGMPTFILGGNLVHFAAFKNHIGFYPTPTGIEKFKKEIAVYEWAKGSVQFPLGEPMPYDLIRKITAFRVKENLARVKAKAKKA